MMEDLQRKYPDNLWIERRREYHAVGQKTVRINFVFSACLTSALPCSAEALMKRTKHFRSGQTPFTIVGEPSSHPAVH
jgi:hypothetical protein